MSLLRRPRDLPVPSSSPLPNASNRGLGRVARPDDAYLALYTLHMKGLAAPTRRALSLVQVGGASYSEAADALGVTRDEVQQMVFEGRSQVGAGIERSYAALRARSNN